MPYSYLDIKATLFAVILAKVVSSREKSAGLAHKNKDNELVRYCFDSSLSTRPNRR